MATRTARRRRRRAHRRSADPITSSRAARRVFNRARVPAPFPAHRWEDHIPSAVVLPTSAEQISEVVKLANRHGIPVVPRAGGTGLTDGAVPLRHGIVVDIKLMNQIHEIDHANRTVTVGPGINMLKLNEELRKHGYIYPDDPASYPCSLVGGRIGTSGWSLIGGRYGHTRDLVISFEIVLPDRRDHPRRRRGRARRSASPRAATSSSTCSWATRGRSGSSPRRRSSWSSGPRPSSRCSSPTTTTWTPGERPASWRARAWRRSPAWSCSTSGRSSTCAATTRPTSHSPTSVKAVIACASYGNADEVTGRGKAPAADRQGVRRCVPRR